MSRVVHLYVPLEESGWLEDGDRLCTPDDPWDGTGEPGDVIAHVTSRFVDGDWRCPACGADARKGISITKVMDS